MMLRKIKYKIQDLTFNHRMNKARKKNGFAPCDCWNMHYWFGDTFVKMIRHLRDNMHGYPQLEFEEIEQFPIDWIIQEGQRISKSNEKKDFDSFDLYNPNDRWNLILSRIAYCFEQSSDEITEIPNEYYEEFNKQVWGDTSEDSKLSFKQWWNKYFVVEKYDKKGKPMSYRLVTNEPEKDLKKKYFDREAEIEEYRESMKDEAFDLLKRYFYCLWD